MLEKIAETIAKASGEKITVNGAEAARKLQLTTQMPTKQIFYTSGNSRNIKIGNSSIGLRHVSSRKLTAAGTIAGLVISALWYLGNKQVNKKVINTIKRQLTEEQKQLFIPVATIHQKDSS